MSNEVAEPEEGSEPETVDPPGLPSALQSVIDQYRSMNDIAARIMETANIGRPIVQQVIDAADIGAMLRERIDPLVRLREYWRDAFSAFESLKERIYPPNLRGVRPSVKEFEQLLLEEGIPLMWVPGPKVVQALLDAPDVAARRQIIGRRWRGIVSDCESVITSVGHADLQEARGFASDCVAALRAGHNNPAQALAANLLDSLMRAHLSSSDRANLTSNKKGRAKFDLNDYGARVALTFAPVWYAHAEYWPKNGDPIPRVFGRHPSTHGVSQAQYSRINAVYGLMLVTSVLKFFDAELDR